MTLPGLASVMFAAVSVTLVPVATGLGLAVKAPIWGAADR
jgi:hypothetical protein